MAVSPLIIVRFKKFKIWHAQYFDALLADVKMTSRVTSRGRGRDVTKDVTNQQSLNLNLVAVPVAMGLSPKP